MKPITDKFAIAAALQEIGSLLELKSGEYFKARAYKTGARAVAELTEDVGKLIKQNRLTFVKGIGFGIAKQVRELYATGESPLLNELRAELPPGILELANVPGLNVKKIEQLHKALGISSIPELTSACEAGKVRQVKGFGVKSEQKILEALAGQVNREPRLHLHQALRAGERMLEFLSTAPGFVRAEVAGALRRRWSLWAAWLVCVEAVLLFGVFDIASVVSLWPREVYLVAVFLGGALLYRERERVPLRGGLAPDMTGIDWCSGSASGPWSSSLPAGS